MRTAGSIVERVYEHRRAFAIGLFALILVVAGGVVFLEVDTTFDEVQIGNDEEAALDRIEGTFHQDDAEISYAQLVVETDNAVFDRDALLSSLELQQDLRTHETIEPTLTATQPTVGVANLVALAAMGDVDSGSVSIDTKIETIASMDQSEIDAIVEGLLAADTADADELWRMLPASTDEVSEVDTAMIVVAQEVDPAISTGAASEAIIESQLAMQELGKEHPASIHVAGNGLLTHEMNQSTEDTLSLLGPLALALVLFVLVIAYRRVLDIVLSLVGILLVLLWTFGTLGWLGIPFNPILIAIPVFLIGLSIDFGLHVFMRYREHRDTQSDSHSQAMVTALAGVGVALLWITVTTVTGFLSNVVSPMQPIRELGLMAAIGIVGAFIVFAGLLPPVKVSIEEWLEEREVGTERRSVGTGDGPIGRLLSTTAAVASRAPVVILVIALLVTGVAGATAVGVDTSFDHEDNIPESAPEWSTQLPGPLAPGEYTVRDNLELVDEEFVREGLQADVLIEGDITDPAVLRTLDEAKTKAADEDSTILLANGDLLTHDPLTLMDQLAQEDPAFADELEAADTTGDGIPDNDLAELYASMETIAPDRTAEVVHLDEEGESAIRLTMGVDGAADGETITQEFRDIAATFDDTPASAIATGEPITHHLIDQELINTILTSLFITLLVVILLLMGVFRLLYDSATLGLVTLLPVAMAVPWIIATVDLLGYSLNIVTALTASLTIGIGIDYSIHVGERFRSELGDMAATTAALEATINGTGEALLASAATTVIGFGVLGVAINPMLQQFGIITAIMIGYAFIGAVIVLPALLTLWAKVACPTGIDLACEHEQSGTPADD